LREEGRNEACFRVVLAEEKIMCGFITTKDVLLHPLKIIGPFGVRVYARCLVRLVDGHGHATFLECI
jgi:hypothetical protein